MCRSSSPGSLGLVLALLLVLAGAGCAASATSSGESAENGDGPIAPSFDPIVFPHPDQEGGGRDGFGPSGSLRENRPVEDEDAGWAEKLELARGYAAGGFEDEAMLVIRGALALEPPSEWGDRFRHLRTTMRLRQMETNLLRVDARGVRDYVRFASDVDFRIRIRNVSDQDIVFPAPGAQGADRSPTALSLEVSRRDVDIYGAELTRSWTQTVYLQQAGGGDIRIPPGGNHEVPARVQGEDAGAVLSGLRILELGGILRGVVLTGSEEEPRSLSLRIRRGRATAVPDGFEPLAERPLHSMDAAIEASAPTHLLVASEFVGRGRVHEGMRRVARALAEGDPALRTAALGAVGRLRRRGVGARLADFTAPLLEAMTTHPDRAEALMEGLGRATGLSLAPDPRLWVDWWRRAREEGARVAPVEPDAGEGGESR